MATRANQLHGDPSRYLLGVFEREEDIMNVSRAARESGIPIVDVYAPYAVHGLDEAIGLKPSKLPWVCFALAVLGAAGKVWFEYWTTWIDWPINVGGKPFDSLPAFIPVTFEVMVLCAGISTVIAFLFGRRLYPGKRASVPFSRITDDRFVLVVEHADESIELERIQSLLEDHHAVYIEERTDGRADQ